MKRRCYEYEIACATSDAERFGILSDEQADFAIRIGARSSSISAQWVAQSSAQRADAYAAKACRAARLARRSSGSGAGK